MPGAPGFKRKLKFDFKVDYVLLVLKAIFWQLNILKGMDRFIKKYNKELDLYVEVKCVDNDIKVK